MKKLLSIILVIVCIFSIVACGKKEEKPFFVSKVIEISDTTILLEVTNNGNCSINEGGQVVIPLDKIAGVISENKDFVINNYLTVEFNGVVLETYPMQLDEIYVVKVTNEKGQSLE